MPTAISDALRRRRSLVRRDDVSNSR